MSDESSFTGNPYEYAYSLFTNSLNFNLIELCKEFLCSIRLGFFPAAFLSLTNMLAFLQNTLFINFVNPLYHLFNQTTLLNTAVQIEVDNSSNSSVNFNDQASDNASQFSEDSSFRFTRFNNPLISYDYKCGNYIGAWEKLYPSLVTSYIEVARGIRKPT